MTEKKHKKQVASGKTEACLPGKQIPGDKKTCHHPDTHADRKDTPAADSLSARDKTARQCEETWEQLRALNENLADGMVYQVHAGLDGRTRQFTYVSPAVERFHELSADALRKDASLLYSQIVPEDRVVLAEKESLAFAGRSKLEAEVRVRMPSGKTAWRRFTSSPRQGADGIWIWDGIEIDITERKHAEEALKESERRYKAIVENQAEFVVRYLPRGIITFINDTLCRYVGMKKEDLLGTSFHPFIHPDDLPSLIRKIDALTQSKPEMAAESRVVLPDGRVRWHSWTHHAIFNELGALVEYQCTGRDVTEQKDMEAALRESEEKYKFLVEATGAGFVILDNQGRVIDANDEYVRMSGHASIRDILGRCVVEWTAAYDQVRNEAEVRKCLEQGYVKDLEIDYIQADGSAVTVEINATVTGDGHAMKIFTLCRDITERKLAEEKLRESESLLRQSQSIARIGHYSLDVLSGTWTSSEVLDEIFGIGPDYPRTVEGWSRIVHPEQRADMLDYFSTRVLGDRSAFDREYRITRVSDGADRWVHGIGRLELGADGRPHRMLGTIQDVTERKKAEREIAEQAAMIRQIMDTASVGIALVDMNGRFTHANKRMAEMFGCEMDELIGSDYVDHVHPSEREAAHRNMKELLASRIPTVEIERHYARKDGTGFWGHLSCRRFYDVHGKELGLIGVITDITERKRAEEEIAERSGMLQQIMDAANVAIFLVNKTGHLTHANHRMTEMFGRTMDDLVGSEYVELVHPSERETGRQKMLSLLASEIQSVDLHRHYSRKDGTGFWGHLVGRRFQDSGGSDIGLIGVITDITEHKKAEDALRESESRFRALFENLSVAAMVIDPSDGSILEGNEAAAAFYGWPRERLRTMNICDINTLSCSEIRARMQEAGSRKQGVFSFRHRRADGSVCEVEVHSGPLEFEGKPALYSIVHDVTERRRFEQALKDSQWLLESVIETAPT